MGSAGCVAAPPLPIDPATRGAALASRSLASDELTRFAAAVGGRAPGATWGVRDLAMAALYYQPRIRVAAAELSRARAGIETARALPNPTLAITPEYSANPARGESPWSPTLQLDWPIATAGKRSDAIDRATAEALAAHYALAEEVGALAREVALARIELAAAEDGLELADETARVANELAEAWRKRVALGAASHAQAAPAESAALDAASELAAARSRAAAARAGLAGALGVSTASLKEIALAPLELSDAAPLGDPATALASRADVLAALARYSAAEATLQGEIARQFPDLRIGSGYQWDQGQSKFLLGLSLDLPVLDRNAGPIAEAIAARARSAAELDAVQVGALAEIESARAALGAAGERRDVARATAAALEAQAARADAAQAAGVQSRVDALAARTLALRARREQREAELALAAARARLAAALAPAAESTGALEAWYASEQR